jgi:putative tryptophan/tyrosine transport system substrate-binding protein
MSRDCSLELPRLTAYPHRVPSPEPGRPMIGFCVMLIMFLALVVGIAPIHARPADKLQRVGILAVNPFPALDGLREGLAGLGYREGQTVHYEPRWAEGRDERLPALAADLARQKVNVIVTWGTPAALAAKHATTTIPIVSILGDPLKVGIATNLSRPGANITGFLTMAQELEAKRLEIIKQLAPTIVRVAVLWNPTNPAVRPSLDIAQSAATGLSLKLDFVEASDPPGLERALAAVASGRAGSLLIMADPFLMTESRRIADFAAERRLPAVANYREYPTAAGGLMSYGPDYADLFRRAAVYLDKIFKGTPPGDLPFQQPSKFELVINLKTVKALGVTIPQSLLLRADQVIQ